MTGTAWFTCWQRRGVRSHRSRWCRGDSYQRYTRTIQIDRSSASWRGRAGAALGRSGTTTVPRQIGAEKNVGLDDDRHYGYLRITVDWKYLHLKHQPTMRGCGFGYLEPEDTTTGES